MTIKKSIDEKIAAGKSNYTAQNESSGSIINEGYQQAQGYARTWKEGEDNQNGYRHPAQYEGEDEDFAREDQGYWVNKKK